MNKKIMSPIVLFMMFVLLLTSVSAQIRTTSGVTVSLINQDPDPVDAGNIVEIRLGVENYDKDPLSNIVIELKPTYPFSLTPGDDGLREIKSLSGYQIEDDKQIIKYKVKVDSNTPANDYDLDLIYYEKDGTIRIERTVTISVKNQESAQVIQIDKTNLIPGKETDLKFIISNVGGASIDDMTFSWSNEDDVILPVGTDNTKYITHLGAGDDVEVTYRVIADSTVVAGLYKLDLNLEYDDSLTGETTTVETIAGVYVGGETDFEITFSEASGSETSFNIANIGSNPAYSVSVSVPKQEGWSVTGANTELIGNLNNGDYTVATFNVRSSGKSDNIAINVTYTDTKGERLSVKKDVFLGSSSTTFSQGANSSTANTADFQRRPGSMGGVTSGIQNLISISKWIGLGIILLIIAIVLFVKFRKKGKNKN